MVASSKQMRNETKEIKKYIAVHSKKKSVNSIGPNSMITEHLVEGGEGCIGPSGKMFMTNLPKYAMQACHYTIYV